MARGGSRHGSGRPKGSKNKKTQAVEEKLEALDCDPIQGIAIIAMDADNPSDLRFKAYKELAQYVAPKRRSIEVRADLAPVDIDELTDEELLAIASGDVIDECLYDPIED